MARRAKPWYWKARKIWCVYHNGEKIPLGPDRDVAFRQYHEIMAKPEKKRQPVQWGAVAAILDDFLTWTEENRRPKNVFPVPRLHPILRDTLRKEGYRLDWLARWSPRDLFLPQTRRFGHVPHGREGILVQVCPLGNRILSAITLKEFLFVGHRLVSWMQQFEKAIARPPAGGYNHFDGNIPRLPRPREFANMFCTYRTLLVIIALNVPSIGGAEEPAAAKSSRKPLPGQLFSGRRLRRLPLRELSRRLPSLMARSTCLADSPRIWMHRIRSTSMIRRATPGRGRKTCRRGSRISIRPSTEIPFGSQAVLRGNIPDRSPLKCGNTTLLRTPGPLDRRCRNGVRGVAWRWSIANYITSAATKPIATRMLAITGVCRSKGEKTGSAKPICPTRVAT